MSTATEDQAATETKEVVTKVYPQSQFLDAYSAHQNGGVIVAFTVPGLGQSYCVAPTTAKAYELIATTYMKAKKLTEKEALLAGQKALAEKK